MNKSILGMKWPLCLQWILCIMNGCKLLLFVKLGLESWKVSTIRNIVQRSFLRRNKIAIGMEQVTFAGKACIGNAVQWIAILCSVRRMLFLHLYSNDLFFLYSKCSKIKAFQLFMINCHFFMTANHEKPWLMVIHF